MNRTAFAIAAAALCTTATMLAPVARAAPIAITDAVPQARVEWTGLDLSSEAGKRELARRTDRAARMVCPIEEITGTRLANPAVAQCRDGVRAQVARRVTGGAQVALRN